MPNQLNWAAKPWQDTEPLECAMVVPDTADTASFTFRAPSGAWFDYQPGQFVTLDLPVPGGSIQRTYTISSSPSRSGSPQERSLPRQIIVATSGEACATSTS